jgi:hypothetical protein
MSERVWGEDGRLVPARQAVSPLRRHSVGQPCRESLDPASSAPLSSAPPPAPPQADLKSSEPPGSSLGAPPPYFFFFSLLFFPFFEPHTAAQCRSTCRARGGRRSSKGPSCGRPPPGLGPAWGTATHTHCPARAPSQHRFTPASPSHSLSNSTMALTTKKVPPGAQAAHNKC